MRHTLSRATRARAAAAFICGCARCARPRAASRSAWSEKGVLVHWVCPHALLSRSVAGWRGLFMTRRCL